MSKNSDQKQIVRRRSGYTSVPNASMADTRLSIEARGLLALLMTFRSDWVFRSSHLMKQCGVGRDKYYRMIGELKEFGYVSVIQDKTEDGKFIGTCWEISDTPFPEKPDTADPDSGFSAHIRENNSLSENKDKTPLPPEGDDLFSANEEQESQRDSIEEGFNEFWDEIWPSHKRKMAKKDCRDVYRAACTGKHRKADKIDSATLNRAARAYIASLNGDLTYLKGTLPWLRQPGWEPFITSPDRAGVSEADLTPRQYEMLREGRVPPSMTDDGKPTTEAIYWLKHFGHGVQA